MKNDLDFIRDQIKNSGVKAPEDMDEAYVAKTLQGVVPQPTAVEQPKRRHKGWKIAISATAAALVLVIALGIVIKGFVAGNNPRSLNLPGGLALKQFTKYDQVKDEVTRIRKANNRVGWLDYFAGINRSAGGDYAADGGAYDAEEYASGSSSSSKNGAVSSAADAQKHSETYEQVAGVSEADIIKTDGRYIYCVDSYNGEIVIFSAAGEKSARVATIDVIRQKAATEDEADFNYEAYYGYGPVIEEIYLRENRLIAVCTDWEDSCDRTIAQVYDVSDVNKITLLDSMKQSGGYDASRMIGDTLYTVSSYSPYENRIIPICGRGEEPDAVPADCIYSLSDTDSDSFLVVSAYNTLDHKAQTESKSVLGGVDDIYCNEDHLYIYSTVWDGRNYGDYWTGGDNASTQILKVDLTDGIRFTAYTKVEGQIDDQYALDEYDGNLRVATTTYEYDLGRDTNNLFVLDESLNQIGAVTGFAKDESIKAVRYLGDTAYVITYEETDPLFVIDLGDPTDPAILGEVKISGFSTMLVPVGEDKLLGIGYHTEEEDYTELEVQEGVKLALFDISDKENPRVLDSKSYVNCTSEVQYNPKALVYNPDRNDFVMPLNYEYWGHYDSKTMEYVPDEELYGGVLNFRVDGDSLSETDYHKTDYEAVDRCVYVGDTIYMTHYENNTLALDWISYK